MYDIDQVYWDIENELTDKFLPHKNRNVSLARFYGELDLPRRAEKVLNCGTFLQYSIPQDFSDGATLTEANFCKDRLCAMCTWRRTLKIFGQVSRVMDVLEKDYQFIFLTLTVRNCSADELKDKIAELERGFSLFRRLRQIGRSFQGYFKALEITRHPDYPKEIEYHPHLHCIIAVSPDYFTTKDYLTHAKLRELWQQALGVDYAPIVNIKKVKPAETEDGDVSLGKAVAEVAKYSVKSDDYLSGTYSQIRQGIVTLLDALTGKRLCSFGGIFKKVARLLELDDMTDGDLVFTRGDKLRADVGYIVIKYQWQIGIGYRQQYTYYEKETSKK
jgi:plasmid rolling circle replication initiator protein Rep